MLPVIAFRSDSPTHRFLSNFYTCLLFFAGYQLQLGSEQAYVLAKALLIVPKTNSHDRRRDEIISQLLKANAPQECKRISREIRQSYPREHDKFVNIQEYVMHSILIQKFSQNPQLHHQLVATGNAILVEANPGDRIWGCGMSYDQVMDSVQRSEARNQQWIPAPDTNLLGRLLMRVRAELLNQRPLVTKVFIGDSLAKRAPLSCPTIIWPGAKLDHVMSLANILTNLTVHDVIICGGTNSLPRAAPWEGLPPDSHDGAQQRANLSKIIEKFQDDLERFPANHPGTRIHLSEIPFRWCDKPKWNISNAPAKMSRIQTAVGEMNKVFLQTARQTNGQVGIIELFYELFHPTYFENVLNESGENEKGLHFSRHGIEKFSQVVNTYIANL